MAEIRPWVGRWCSDDRRRLVFDVLAVNKLAALKIAEEVPDG